MYIATISYEEGPGTYETFYSTDLEALEQRVYRWYEENAARDEGFEDGWKSRGWFKYHVWDAFAPALADGTPCEYLTVITEGRPAEE